MEIWEITTCVANSVAFSEIEKRHLESAKRRPAMRNVSRPGGNVSPPIRIMRQKSELLPSKLKFLGISEITLWVAKSATFPDSADKRAIVRGERYDIGCPSGGNNHCSGREGIFPNSFK